MIRVGPLFSEVDSFLSIGVTAYIFRSVFYIKHFVINILFGRTNLKLQRFFPCCEGISRQIKKKEICLTKVICIFMSQGMDLELILKKWSLQMECTEFLDPNAFQIEDFLKLKISLREIHPKTATCQGLSETGSSMNYPLISVG